MKKIIIFVNVLVIVITSIFIIRYLAESYSSKNTYKEISKTYREQQDKIKKNDSDMKNSPIESIRYINDEIISWIDIPGTNINYPVVQGDNNEFYLNHGIDKNRSIHGSIFMDYRNTLSEDDNLIIYGHRMKDGSMFENLKYYKDRDFFDKNQYINLNIDGKNNKYKIFASYVTKGNTDYLITNFDSKDDFLSYIKSINKKSFFNENTSFQGDEKILTLSTCTYEFNNARMVVHAYLVYE